MECKQEGLYLRRTRLQWRENLALLMHRQILFDKQCYINGPMIFLPAILI